VKTLVDAGKTGVARDPEVRWDGKKILFSMRQSASDNITSMRSARMARG
jgi:hypothetical protein